MATTPSHKKSSFEEGSLDQYLRDISAYPLITREDEVDARAAHSRRATRRRSTSSCARTCASSCRVAKKYQNQGVSLSDLINEGNLGLIRAAHKFDETKGIKFISYAVWWIRQAILQALAEQSPHRARPAQPRRHAAPDRQAREHAAAGARARGDARRDRRRDGHHRGRGREDDVHLAGAPLARRAADAGRGQQAPRLPARQPEPDAGRADVREGAHRGDRGGARAA